MKIDSSDPIIKSIIDLIENNVYDLKPDFQRDIVWPIEKQQKLIDSIMRGWHIPPIHVVQTDKNKNKFEVLDGKQRLNSIFNFYKDGFPFNATFLPEPVFDNFTEIHRKKFSQLSENYKHKFLFAKIRILEVTDVKMYEATELFLRLNTGVNVSASEKRNCIYGPTKEFIREIINDHDKLFCYNTLGFTNLRMAYQDVLDRIFFLERNGNLDNKPTTGALEKMYFEPYLDVSASNNLKGNIISMEEVFADFFLKDNYKLTKSTMMSYYWLIRELKNNGNYNFIILRKFIDKFEEWRSIQREKYENNTEIHKKYYEFEAYLSEGWLDPSSLKGRHEILTQYYSEFYNTGKFGAFYE